MGGLVVTAGDRPPVEQGAILESIEVVLHDLARDRDRLAWEVLELRLKLAGAGLDPGPADAGHMTAKRVRALEDAVDMARDYMRHQREGSYRRTLDALDASRRIS